MFKFLLCVTDKTSAWVAMKQNRNPLKPIQYLLVLFNICNSNSFNCDHMQYMLYNSANVLLHPFVSSEIILATFVSFLSIKRKPFGLKVP